MKALKPRSGKIRLIICLLLIGTAIVVYLLEPNEYGFVFGEKAERRLNSYTWVAETNQIRPLPDPSDAFQARRQLIQQAESRIDIATFVWRDDLSSRVLFDDLINACERGVDVRIIGDGVFFLRELGRVKAMAEAHENLELRVYNPLDNQLASIDLKSLDNLGWEFDQTNHRFHIKLFTIDGNQTLIGGRNIGDRYFGLAEDYNFIDLDLWIRGPAVKQADKIFDAYWNHSLTRDVLELSDVSEARAVLKSRPDTLPESSSNLESEWKTVRRMAIWADPPEVMDTVPGYQPNLLADRLAALAGTAKKELLVASPYLVLSERSHAFMKELREQNPVAKLHFLTNSLAASDSWKVYTAFHAQLQWLLSDYRLLVNLKKPTSLRKQAGAEHSVSSLHTKAWVVDERWATVGSFNWDPRSEIFNSEVMAVIDDPEFASWLRKHLIPLSKPENAWVVGKRDLPIGVEQIDDLVHFLNTVSRELTGLQAWSVGNVSCFEPVGKSNLTPYDDGFYTAYKAVGPFPEVKATDTKRLYTLLLQPVSDLLKPAL